ncbi:SPFH domain-containing protein [Catenulispora subtropica]
MWRVAEPNQALIVSGRRHREGQDGLGFRIVTGGGSFVVPGVQVVRRLSLDLNEAELDVECVTRQGIPLHVKGVVIFKVGDDHASIANAARRFLDQQGQMGTRVHNIFAGHLRSIVGGLTVEEMIGDRERLTEQTRATSGTEMEKLGLIIDSLQIQEIGDPTGYIKALSAPHAAAVTRDARIAQAAADQSATEAEAEANARKAEAMRNASIQQAGYQAEVEQAQAKTRQAGPLADAQARQEVVVQETRVAELEAQRKEQQLQVEVRKPADARAYETVTLAHAEREAKIHEAEAHARETELRAAADATRVRTEAEAEAQAKRALGQASADAAQAQALADAEARKARGLADAEARKAEGLAEATAREAQGRANAEARRAQGLAEAEAAKALGLAEAEAIKARGEALAEHQEAIITQQLVAQLPTVVAAGAKSFENVEHMVLLNGADGVTDVFGKALTMGGTGLGLARQMLASMGDQALRRSLPEQNGAAQHEPKGTEGIEGIKRTESTESTKNNSGHKDQRDTVVITD